MNTDSDYEKITLRIFAGDKQRIQSYYPDLWYQQVIRQLLRQHLEMLDAQAGIDRQSEVETLRRNTPYWLGEL